MRNKKSMVIVILVFLVITGIGVSVGQTFGSGRGSSGFFGSDSSWGSGWYGGGNAYTGGFGSYQGTSGPRVYGASINPQFTNPSFFSAGAYTNPEVYWPKFRMQDCYARQDIIMQIAPGGCSPAVVRSDLLEEQNVPVFCKVMGIQMNPLIDISNIRSLRFHGNYPPGISGISYFPARAAVRSTQKLENSPVQDNLGYLVIVVSRQEIEGEMPDFIGGNITATIDYDTERAFGTGNTNFYLSEMNDEEWYRDYKQYGFWNGKGYIRADTVYFDEARISIYRDANTKQATVNLRKGESSRDIYLSGFYCSAGLNLRLDEIGAPVDSALLQINDQQVWVAQGDRIMDGKCRVTRLETYGGGGKVEISCPVQNGRFDLMLNPGKAKISNRKNQEKEYIIGEEIDIADTKNVYLAYVGIDRGAKYAVIVKDDFSQTSYDFAEKDVYSVIDRVAREDKQIGNLPEKIEQAVLSHYQRGIRGLKKEDERLKIEVLIEGKPGNYGIYVDEALVAENREWNFENEGESLAKEYYDQAIRHFEDLADLYPNEKMPYIQEDSYAAQGLYEAAQLAKEYEQYEKAQEIYNRLIIEYPESNIAKMAIREKEMLTKYDNRMAKATVYVNEYQYSVQLLEIKKPTREEASAVLLIDGREEVLGLYDIKTIERDGRVQSIQLERIDNEYATVRYGSFDYTDYYRNFYGEDFGDPHEEEGIDYNNDGKIDDQEKERYKRETSSSRGGSSYNTRRLRIGEQTLLGNLQIRLLDIRLKEQVKISINPKVRGTRTQTNFTFRIGIEKRGIKLSPEQTLDLMKSLEKTIKEWNVAKEKLGKTIKGLKAACFATSAMLTIKNLFEGLSGKSMARRELMTNQEGWNDYCKEIVEEGKKSSYTGEGYSSIQNCLLGHNKDIDDEIDLYAEKIKETNDKLREIQEKIGIEKTDILDFKGQVDMKKLEENFKQEFEEFCNRQTGGSITIPERPIREEENISFTGENGICDWSENNSMTHEQRRDLMTLFETKKAAGDNTVLGKMADKELGRIALDAKNFHENNIARIEAQRKAKENNLGLEEFIPIGDSIDYGPVKRITQGDKNHHVYKNYETGDSVIRITIPIRKNFGAGEPYVANETIAGKTVIIQVKEDEFHREYIPDKEGKVFTIEGKEVTGAAKESVLEYLSLSGINRIIPLNQKAYQNKMVNPERLKVDYFEREPYKGLPSLVPFDIINGWYVKLTYVLSGFGRPYDESGRAVNFWICNVGRNGQIEFKRSADDICIYYNGHLDDYHQYGMSRQEFGQLVNKAQQAIMEASRQYGQSTAVINGRSFKTGIDLGGEEGRCSDFMSPQDCHLMFNVCDPVICPASRCDLGGKFRVDNVMQSGIIGSLLLCLPNAKEGILVPVCLTGVHAGVEGYLSILNSTVMCLNESLETGRNIGICDEIKSIYLCEFFWKQAQPLLQVLVPRVLEGFYSQGVRGGGEYLTIQEAWSNTKSAINYFQTDYAINSMQAFNERSTDEIGGEVCKSFVSARFPTSKHMFDLLIEPDSPVQFHAWFSESQITTATIPPTSHYKVYYHIYAGKDMGAYYEVYLKDLPRSGYVYTMNYQVVDRGYLPRGTQIDQARDFTAPSGYKQLCVNVNGQDECGFGSVSTSYALNRIADEYAKDQIKTGIRTSKECVAGTPSLYSAMQPNIQAGVESTIEPELYRRGIVRVCSTENPGKQVLATGEFDRTNSTYDRWKTVGYCDDPTIICWLDTSSVKDVIKDLEIETEVLKQVDLNILGEIDYWTEEQSRTTADWAENAIAGLTFSQGEDKESIESKIAEIVERLTRLSNLGFPNVNRARAHLWLGRLYMKIATGIKPELVRGGILSPEEFEKIFLEEDSEVSFDAPSEDCKIESARLIQTSLETGQSFKMNVKFSGKCEDWNIITIKAVPGGDTSDPGIVFSHVLSEQDIRRRQATIPTNEFLEKTKIRNPGTYGFVIGITTEKMVNGQIRRKTEDKIYSESDENLILVVTGEPEEKPDEEPEEEPEEEKPEETVETENKVTWDDITEKETEAGTVYIMQIYDPTREELIWITFTDFSEENQEITYWDGSKKKVSKDEKEGWAIFQ
jgi:hypothetical protein